VGHGLVISRWLGPLGDLGSPERIHARQARHRLDRPGRQSRCAVSSGRRAPRGLAGQEASPGLRRGADALSVCSAASRRRRGRRLGSRVWPSHDVDAAWGVCRLTAGRGRSGLGAAASGVGVAVGETVSGRSLAGRRCGPSGVWRVCARRVRCFVGTRGAAGDEMTFFGVCGGGAGSGCGVCASSRASSRPSGGLLTSAYTPSRGSGDPQLLQERRFFQRSPSRRAVQPAGITVCQFTKNPLTDIINILHHVVIVIYYPKE
jgi:hypothetical protein